MLNSVTTHQNDSVSEPNLPTGRLGGRFERKVGEEGSPTFQEGSEPSYFGLWFVLKFIFQKTKFEKKTLAEVTVTVPPAHPGTCGRPSPQNIKKTQQENADATILVIFFEPESHTTTPLVKNICLSAKIPFQKARRRTNNQHSFQKSTSYCFQAQATPLWRKWPQM